MLNNLQIKQYQNTILTNVLTSQFVYSCINQKCELKNQALILENKKKKKINYWYLFLLANRKPYVKKYSIHSKNIKKNATKPKMKFLTWKVEIKKKNFSEILVHTLFEMLPLQTNSEKKILQLRQKNVDLILQYASLTSRTIGLKPKNSYFPDLRLIWRLKNTAKTSIFQKIFLLKQLHILNEQSLFKRLENDVE